MNPVVDPMAGLQRQAIPIPVERDEGGPQAPRGNLPPVEVDIVLDGSTEPIQIRSGAERGFRQHKLPELKSKQALTLNIRAEKTGARFFCWELIRDR